MGILAFLIMVLVAFWLLGLIFSIGGGLIHILLVIALVIIVFRLLTGQRL